MVTLARHAIELLQALRQFPWFKAIVLDCVTENKQSVVNFGKTNPNRNAVCWRRPCQASNGLRRTIAATTGEKICGGRRRIHPRKRWSSGGAVAQTRADKTQTGSMGLFREW